MSQSNLNGSGVLVFNGEAILTPVIHALFDAFNLGGNKPAATNEACIAMLANDNGATWQDVTNHVSSLVASLDEWIPDVPEDAMLVTCLELLEERYGEPEEREKFSALLVEVTAAAEDNSDVSLGLLFDLAQLLNDGHNLVSIRFECSWHSDKATPGAFGGESLFFSNEVSMWTSTPESLRYATTFRNCLAGDDLEGAAHHIWQNVREQLLSIHKNAQRDGIEQALLNTSNMALGTGLAEAVDTSNPIASLANEVVPTTLIKLIDLIGPFNDVSQIPEWIWMCENTTSSARAPAVTGGKRGLLICIFAVNLAHEDIPARLQPAFDQARSQGTQYLIIQLS